MDTGVRSLVAAAVPQGNVEQSPGRLTQCSWVPAFAGMTRRGVSLVIRRERIEAEERHRQVLPEWVFLFDQLDLPAATPFLDPALAHDRIAYVVIGFDVDEPF